MMDMMVVNVMHLLIATATSTIGIHSIPWPPHSVVVINIAAPELSHIDQWFFIWNVVLHIPHHAAVEGLIKSGSFDLHLIYLIDQNRLLVVLSVK
jgi:hypothetical protein